MRPVLSDEQIEQAVAAVPAPDGCSWQLDHAASSDRLRLFYDAGGLACDVYPDGEWSAYAKGGYFPRAEGCEADLIAAMRAASERAHMEGT